MYDYVLKKPNLQTLSYFKEKKNTFIIYYIT